MGRPVLERSLLPYLIKYKRAAELDAKYVVCDIETTGLIELDGTMPDTIHVIVCYDLLSKERYIFDTQEKIHKEFPKFAATVDMWIGHNFLSYDVPVLNAKIDGCNIKWDRVIDTLVLSRLFNPMVPKQKYNKKTGKTEHFNGLKRSEHSLDFWGTLVGYAKQEHEDWTVLTEAMIRRCVTDVELNVKVYEALLQEGRDFSERSIYIEHSITQQLFEQKMTGFQLDVPKSYQLLSEIRERRDELKEAISKEACSIWRPKYVKVLRRNQDGTLHGADRKYMIGKKFKKLDEADHYLIYEEIPFDIGSNKWVRFHMDRAGWEPTEFTKTGLAKLNEANLSTLPDTAPQVYKQYAEYSMCNARVKEIEGWHEAMCAAGKVHGDGLSVGAKTHRQAHRNPNTANIPGNQSPYGKECRSCWTVEDPDHNHLLGTDASGIQLRMLAHYIDDPEYTEGVLVDPHTTHQHILGLPKRALAKTWMYAWLFGAAATRLGRILGGGAKEGQATMDLFEQRVPGLKKLGVAREKAARDKRLLGLDGRYIPVPNMHGSLPAFLQGGEAAVMKLARHMWYWKARQLGWDFDVCADVHDEWQCRCSNSLLVETTKPKFFAGDLTTDEGKKKHEAEVAAYSPDDKRVWSAPVQVSKSDNGAEYIWHYHKLGELQVKAIREAGKKLGLNCPLDGEYNIGSNWYQTH